MKDIIDRLFTKTETSSVLCGDADGLVTTVMSQLLCAAKASETEIRRIVIYCHNFLNDKNHKGLLLAQTIVKIFTENLLICNKPVK